MADNLDDYMLRQEVSNGFYLAASTPNLKRLSEYDQKRLPRLLFRAYSSGSMGKNRPNNFTSQAQKDVFIHNPDLRLEIQNDLPNRFQESVKNHLTWVKFSSPFISMTNSLLLCLGWAHRLQSTKKLRRRHVDLSIEVIDTTKIRSGIVLPAQLLSGIVERDPSISRTYRPTGNYDQEYLAYGALHGDFSCVPYEDIAATLEAYIPELRTVYPGGMWAERLQQLRISLFNAQDPLHNPNVRMQTAKLVQELSGSAHEFRLPLLLSVLAMRKGWKSGQNSSLSVITGSFHLRDLIDTFGIRKTARSSSGLAVFDFKVPECLKGKDAPEHMEAADLAEAVCLWLRYEQDTKLELLVSSSNDTSLIYQMLVRGLGGLQIMLTTIAACRGEFSQIVRIIAGEIQTLEMEWDTFRFLPTSEWRSVRRLAEARSLTRKATELVEQFEPVCEPVQFSRQPQATTSIPPPTPALTATLSPSETPTLVPTTADGSCKPTTAFAVPTKPILPRKLKAEVPDIPELNAMEAETQGLVPATIGGGINWGVGGKLAKAETVVAPAGQGEGQAAKRKRDRQDGTEEVEQNSNKKTKVESTDRIRKFVEKASASIEGLLRRQAS